MPIATLTASTPVFLPLVGGTVYPGQPFEVTEAQAESLKDHPFFIVIPDQTGAVPPSAPDLGSANQVPQTAVSEAASESEV